jgi:hypothetical protein
MARLAGIALAKKAAPSTGSLMSGADSGVAPVSVTVVLRPGILRELRSELS